jgi:hypothetical protein
MDEILDITPAEAFARMSRGARLVDVREPDEHALGLPRGALALPRAELERSPDKAGAGQRELLLICGSGPATRSGSRAPSRRSRASGSSRRRSPASRRPWASRTSPSASASRHAAS